MVTSVSAGLQNTNIAAKIVQPGGNEQDRQVKDTAREDSRRADRLESSARSEQINRSQDVQRDENRAETRAADEDRSRNNRETRSTRGSVLDVTV
ncbi:MAG: hypothetical protein J0L77_09080 [Alphaproteobacteria bacterium]|nr:hypothetical protein [Alphaproteobacteria bacterium]